MAEHEQNEDDRNPMNSFDARSGIVQTNLQEIVDAAVSVKAATLNGQQQYQTPKCWAEYLAKLLPTTRASCVFDPQAAEGNVDVWKVRQAWEQLAEVLTEEAEHRSPWNVWLAPDGKLRIYLSLRYQIKRKLSREDVQRLSRVHDCHPLALTTETETRSLLRELADSGAYTIQPEAAAAIRSALEDVARISAPIMPVTDFERVAYADELDSLAVRADYAKVTISRRLGMDPDPSLPQLTPGKRYPIRTAAYRFTESFTRKKPTWVAENAECGTRNAEQAAGKLVTVDHECELSGQDRYVQVQDDAGKEHRFLAHPEKCEKMQAQLHPEAMLWDVFEKPEVPTIVELHPAAVAGIRVRLLAMCGQS
jgi:hypothetical protein